MSWNFIAGRPTFAFISFFCNYTNNNLNKKYLFYSGTQLYLSSKTQTMKKLLLFYFIILSVHLSAQCGPEKGVNVIFGMGATITNDWILQSVKLGVIQTGVTTGFIFNSELNKGLPPVWKNPMDAMYGAEMGIFHNVTDRIATSLSVGANSRGAIVRPSIIYQIGKFNVELSHKQGLAWIGFFVKL